MKGDKSSVTGGYPGEEEGAEINQLPNASDGEFFPSIWPCTVIISWHSQNWKADEPYNKRNHIYWLRALVYLSMDHLTSQFEYLLKNYLKRGFVQKYIRTTQLHSIPVISTEPERNVNAVIIFHCPWTH